MAQTEIKEIPNKKQFTDQAKTEVGKVAELLRRGLETTMAKKKLKLVVIASSPTRKAKSDRTIEEVEIEVLTSDSRSKKDRNGTNGAKVDAKKASAPQPPMVLLRKTTMNNGTFSSTFDISMFVSQVPTIPWLVFWKAPVITDNDLDRIIGSAKPKPQAPVKAIVAKPAQAPAQK